MGFRGISWAGLNSGEFAQTVDFFRERVGLELSYRDDESEVAHFRLTSGDMFEVFGPEHPDEVAPEQQLAIAFEVDDLEVARAHMEKRGVSFLTPIERFKDHAWCYFEGPGGVVFEIKQSGNRP